MRSRSRRVIHVCLWLGLAGLAVGLDVAAAAELRVEGVWEHDGRLGRTRVVFGLDHNWTYRFEGRETYEEYYGAWSVKDGALRVLQANGKTLTFTIRPLGRLTMHLEDADGARITLRRTKDPAPPTAIPSSPLASPFENRPVRPRLRHRKPSATGHILYTRVQVIQGVVLPRIHIMDGDGRNQAPFIAPEKSWSADDATWSPDGKRVAFASNYEMPRSALYTDLFVADLETGRTCRITGNEVYPVAVERGGSAEFRMFQLPRGVHPWDFGFSVQGGPWQPPPRGDWRQAPLWLDTVWGGLPQGRPFWMKCWHGKHVGCLRTLDALETIEPSPHKLGPCIAFDAARGNELALRPRFTPDGKRLLCTWHRAFYVRSPGRVKRPLDPLRLWPKTPQERDPNTEHFRDKDQGTDTIALVDIRRGTPPLVEWKPAAGGGQPVRSPTISPDGEWIAFEVGEVGVQGLAVSTMDDFLNRRHELRVFAQGGTRPQSAGKISHGDPAWSPDGRHIAFCSYVLDLHGAVTGTLQLVDAADGKVQELARFGATQIPARPCWSPDCEQLAFALVTSKGRALTVLDIVGLNVTSDVAVVQRDGSGLRTITTDGRSSAPAWGP